MKRYFHLGPSLTDLQDKATKHHMSWTPNLSEPQPTGLEEIPNGTSLQGWNMKLAIRKHFQSLDFTLGSKA
jgi:hypothetical protein